MTHKFSQLAKKYKRRTFSKKYCKNIAVDMTLNNMKIEDQAVSKKQFEAFIKKNG